VEAYERTDRMNAFYIWERDSFRDPMMQSALKQGKNFVRREWTCEPKEMVRSKVMLRNLGVGLNVRGVPVKVSWG